MNRKRQYVLGILLCAAVWGLAEAALGGWMYDAGYRRAAPVVLSVIALAVLTLGRLYVPLAGSSTAIAAGAMLFKFLNQPLFVCHLLAIFLLGAGYDAVYCLAQGRAKPLIGAAASYMGFALFAVIITYVVRYEYWSPTRCARYVGLLGTIAAACNAVVVPLADAAGRRVTAAALARGGLRTWGFRAAAGATAALWAVAAVRGGLAACGVRISGLLG